MNTICHYLLLENPECYDRYGVAVCTETETTSIPHITHSRQAAVLLLERLKNGSVTPCTAQDIVDDFLADL